jgi:hypothetical protein
MTVSFNGGNEVAERKQISAVKRGNLERFASPDDKNTAQPTKSYTELECRDGPIVQIAASKNAKSQIDQK